MTQALDQKSETYVIPTCFRADFFGDIDRIVHSDRQADGGLGILRGSIASQFMNPRVIIVDEDDGTIQLAKKAMSEAGYDCDTALRLRLRRSRSGAPTFWSLIGI